MVSYISKVRCVVRENDNMNALKPLSLLLCMAIMTATSLHATADGPDHLRVIGVSPESVLNMRSTPSNDGTVIHSIPADADGLLSFGCVGGLSPTDWQTASEADRAAARKTRWCLVGYDTHIGWSAGWFLGEGSGPDTAITGKKLDTLTGSEWVLRDLVTTPAKADAWIRFDKDGTALGSSGCNRFSGSVDTARGNLSFGPLAMTRRACPPAENETETAFMAALANTARTAASDRVLALFDQDNVLLATLTRREVD